MNALRVTVLLGALALLAPRLARAEPQARPVSPPGSDARKVLRPGEVEIRGKVRRPTPPPITPPSVSTQEPERRKSFLPRIVEAVDREPFQP